jgi:arylsulfatase A-like enzyme
VREVLRFLGKWLLRPSSVGALYLLALVALAARDGTEADRALGGQTRAIQHAVERHFGGEIERMTVAIVAVTVLLGALLGTFAGLLLLLRDRVARTPERGPLRQAAVVLAVVAVIHALAETYAMADAPQLYADAFYARGGLLRLLQVIVTDDLGRGGVVAVATVILLLFLAGPVRSWRMWPSRLSRAFLPRGPGGARRALVGAAGTAAVVAGVLALPSPSREAFADAPGRAPNVLVLAADSLRADRLDPKTAPNLSRLAERGTRFDRAYVSLPRTFPSWVTLLSGRHPHHHGIRSMFPRWEERTKDFDALPERLARAGYTTSVVSDFAGDIFDRIDLGWTQTQVPTFDFRQLVRQRALERETPLLPFLHSRAGRSIFPILREMNDAADPDMLASDVVSTIQGSRGKPFFLTVFFSTAHFPYAAPAPYYRRYTDRGYRGRFKYHKPVGLEHDDAPDEADIAQVRGLYDGAVASIDAASAKILGALDRLGLAKNTIVVVVADHGEMLWENGHGEGHGDHLFGDEVTHVPLVVFDPRKPGGQRTPAIVRDVDLAPTLYDLLGVGAPGDLDGQSLVPMMTGAPAPPRLAYAETGLWFTEDVSGFAPSLRIPYPGVSEITEVEADHHDDVVLKKEMTDLVLVAKHRMVRDERYKLVYLPTRAGVRYELFDTDTDPGETRDLAAERPTEVSRLKGELWKWMLGDPRMIQRGGYLVPRVAGASEPDDEGASGHVIRIDSPAKGSQ